MASGARGLGDAARHALATVEARVASLAERGAEAEDPYAIRAERKAVMKEHFGVFREEGQMRAGLARLAALKERCAAVGLRPAGGAFNLDLLRTLELEGMLDVALAVATGALRRTESRGSHARTDYPGRDDAAGLKHTLAQATDGGPQLTDKSVTPGPFEPRERTY